jgi:hypothetical protein
MSQHHAKKFGYGEHVATSERRLWLKIDIEGSEWNALL